MIVITGVTKGIGRAIAERLAKEGKAILGVARSEVDLNAMQETWNEQFPEARLLTVVADLSNQEGCDKVSDVIDKRALPIAYLVHNVGLFTPGHLLGEEDVLAELLPLNLLAAHRLTRRLLPAMISRGEGGLVTIGSVATTDFPEGMGAYTVSKYALEGWHKALVNELSGTGLTTSLIVPGATLTASWDGQDYDPSRILSPDQVAEAVWMTMQSSPPGGDHTIVLRPAQ